MTDGMFHLHILSWVVLIIVFFASYSNFSDRLGPSKYFKPLLMVQRLFALLVIASGIYLFVEFMKNDATFYGIKFLLGLITIGMMEMTIAKKKKKKPSRTFFYLAVLFIILTVGLGIHLPMGPITIMFK
ncbi:YisL family protein [Macrococcus armenti]|uniref:YisL family protein n=1 Tax=Macrococcus armenti TaxID=2875764 RepID=UPI001CCCC110|nr:YisL family protein [Macrococcus armenti]UBH09276.1 YisL family protein [Macrococcus armenti]UBH11572.1 YisL family protein [Macrococcus armenti]